MSLSGRLDPATSSQLGSFGAAYDENEDAYDLGEFASSAASIDEDVRGAWDGLCTAWVNERVAPEILVYQMRIVDMLKSRIEAQQENLFGILDEGSGPASITHQIMQLEVDRIRFMLASYLRTRLQKIEKYVMKILLSDDVDERLSQPELNYAKEYVDALAGHFEQSFLLQIPERVRTLDDVADDSNNMVAGPDLDQHVFLRITEYIGPFVVPNMDETQMNLDQGDIILGRYSAFKLLLETNRAQLI